MTLFVNGTPPQMFHRSEDGVVTQLTNSIGVSMAAVTANARAIRLIRLRAALHEIFQRHRLAQPGATQAKVDEFVAGQRVDVRTEVNGAITGYCVSFRLPRWNGTVSVPADNLPEVEAGTTPASATHSHEWRDAYIKAVEGIVAQGARELRGRALLELADMDWAIQDDPHNPERWQQMERAGNRLMEVAEILLKQAKERAR